MCPNPNGFPWNFSPRARERTSFQTAPGVPIMAYTGELLPKGVPFSGFRYMKRGRDFTRSSIWKGTEICHLDLWKGILRGRRKKGRGRGEGETKGPNRWILWLYIVGKTICFCDWFLFKWQYINLKVQQLKGMQSYKQRMWKTLHFVNRRYRKGVPFSWEIAYSSVRLEQYAEPPRTKICWVPPPPGNGGNELPLFLPLARGLSSLTWKKYPRKTLRTRR